MKNGNYTTKQNITISVYLVLAIVALFVVTLYGFYYLTNSVNKKIIEINLNSMEELALHDSRSIGNSISLRWKNMEGVAEEISKTDYDGLDEFFAVMKAKTPDIPSAVKISLLDSNGTNYISNGVVEQNSYLADVCNRKREHFAVRLNTDTHFRENVNEVIFLGVPVDFFVGENCFKWMICQFPINTLEDELKISSFEGKGYSSVIDINGNYVINISRDHSFLTYDNFYNDIGPAKFENFEDAHKLKKFITSEMKKTKALVYTMDGIKSIMVITPFEITDWYFISTVPVSVFDEQSNYIITSFSVLMLIISVILAVVLFLYVLQRKKQTELKISNAANRTKTEFLFNMSHDIRTPMNAILGYTDIALKHKDDSSKVNESLEKIKFSGAHLLNLINDILEMSRIESGKFEITEDPTDLRRLIEGVSEMSLSLAIEKSIDFKTEIEEFENPYVYIDKLHANEVFINLISNAVKYTPAGGKIRFKAKQSGEVADGKAVYSFEVVDNGIGMSEEFQKHLYEAFSRENTSTVSGQQGAGLGLSIVKNIVDMSGGVISVKSKVGVGSAFTVDIPLRVMEDDAVEEYKKQNKPLDLKENKFTFEGKKVLLVEDNEMNREIATEILEEVGLVIDTAEDGEFAVKAVEEKGTAYYDFVLMDIQMPVMDGYTATREIRKLPGGDKMTIIALSANAFQEDVQKSLESGMNSHVAKPIDVKILFDTMKELAEKK